MAVFARSVFFFHQLICFMSELRLRRALITPSTSRQDVSNELEEKDNNIKIIMIRIILTVRIRDKGNHNSQLIIWSYKLIVID